MSRIGDRFETLRQRGGKALMPFITAGDPDLETTLALLHSLDETGADIVEVGVPFSDPMADGVVIQRSSERALRSGTTLAAILDMLAEFRRKGDLPLCVMSYFNPIYRMGLKRFAALARRAGVDGVIIPDLPMEESTEARRFLRPAGLDLIPFLAPTSGEDRMRMASRLGSGFIYCVSLLGTTGLRDRLPSDLQSRLRKIREICRLPLCVGFGVSSPEQARAVAQGCDGVIVGSAIVRVIETCGDPAKVPERTRAFVRELLAAVRSVEPCASA